MEKYGTVEFKPTIKFPLEYAHVWSCENVDKMLALFEEKSYIDFDDRYDFGAFPDLCTTSFNLVSEFSAMDIIENHEDNCYYAGKNYDEFRAYWESLKAAKKVMVSEEIEQILTKHCLIRQQDSDIFNAFLDTMR